MGQAARAGQTRIQPKTEAAHPVFRSNRISDPSSLWLDRSWRGIDRWLNFPKLILQPLNLIFGVLLIVIGWFFELWSNYVQFTIGRGTPLPLIATQKLIIQPPYSYCRNPMGLGAIVMYLGAATQVSSIGAVILVILGAAALLFYIKVLEEEEMVMRFGAVYLAYRQRTPFLIPRFLRKARD